MYVRTHRHTHIHAQREKEKKERQKAIRSMSVIETIFELIPESNNRMTVG